MHGSSSRGKPVGSHSGLAAHSFNGNTMITPMGGGWRAIMHLGTSIRRWGYNYRMSNVLAGIGRGRFEVLPTLVRQRRDIAFRDGDAFCWMVWAREFMPQSPLDIHTFLIEEQFGTFRDALIAALDDAGIESRPKSKRLQPLHRNAEYLGGDIAEDLVPSSLTLDDQTAVIDAIRLAAGVSVG